MDHHIESSIKNGQDMQLPAGERKPASAPNEPSLKPRNLLLDSSDILPALKFSCLLGIVATMCALSLQNPSDIFRSRNQFKAWYSQYSYQFNIIADSCTDEYSIYLYGTRQNTTTPTLEGAGGFTLFIQPMINCLLKNASEYIKYQLATSQVLLGITPTIICLLGATSEEVCFLALVGRRRLLGLLLSAASPSIYTERAFKYQDPDQILKDLNDNHVKSTVITKPRWLFVVMEYIAVLAAIANAAALNWQLGVQSINSLSANTVYMPMIWSFFGICAHLLGAVVFGMRTRRLDQSTMQATPRSTIRSCLSCTCKALHHPTESLSMGKELAHVIHTELFWLPEEIHDLNEEHPEPSDDGNPRKRIYFTLLAESRCFTFLAWLFSVVVIVHIVIGTMILSSTNFVGPKDALAIMVRYILSVVICRIVLVYELAVLRMEYKPQAQSGM